MKSLTPKIKICGLTSLYDAKMAEAAGATDLGFVMGGSVLPQEIEPRAQHVREAITQLQARTHLVTHLLLANEINDLANYINCYGIQVSEAIAVSELKKLRRLTDKPIIKTIPTNQDNYLNLLDEYTLYCNEILVDSTSSGYVGGTGSLNDLSRCANVVRVSQKPVWLAGGLTPENVADSLIKTGAHYADVSTGVSCYSLSFPRKDRKDPNKCNSFVANALGVLC